MPKRIFTRDEIVKFTTEKGYIVRSYIRYWPDGVYLEVKCFIRDKGEAADTTLLFKYTDDTLAYVNEFKFPGIKPWYNELR